MRNENSNFHLYGFYKVGNNLHYSKMDALSDHIGTSNTITWHLFEEEFNSVNLTNEPAESLEELYAVRARNLREEYDYLVLHYSGGTDSKKVLDIFYKNNIKIDEIFSRTYSEGERRQAYESGNDPEAIEPEFLTKPQLEFIKNNIWPDVKITQIDITDAVISSLANGKWFKEKSIVSTEGGVAWRGDLELAVPEWLELANKGKKIGHIIGKEKTFILRDDIGYYFNFNDKHVVNWLVPRNRYVGYPQYVELFFWHPSTIKIILKQAHILLKCSKLDPSLLNPNGMWTREWENKVANIIYGSTILPYPVTTFKAQDWESSNKKITTCTNWWVVRDKSSEHFKHWIKGVHDLYSEIQPMYDNFVDFWHKGIPSIITKKHYIAYHNV